MNIYHVIWDNEEPWPEDHSERHVVIAAETKEQAIEHSCLRIECGSRGNIEAELVYENVTLNNQ